MAHARTRKVRECPLCGAAFSSDQSHCAGGCPMAANCRVLCCPACGYEFIEDSILISGAQRLLRWIRRKQG